jgi:hypothetical protein
MAFTHKPTIWQVVLNQQKQAIMLPIRSQGSQGYLTYADIMDLSVEDRTLYQERDTQMMVLNPQIQDLYEEMEREDRRVYELECSSSSDDEM